MSAQKIIRNGTIVTASEIFQTDILIRDEKIVALGATDAEGETVDARGMYIFPGGIDPHVHLHYPQGAQRIYSADDWLTGTVAAAHSGTTTVIDFVEARPDESMMQAFEKRNADAAENAVIDYSFHMTINRTDDARIAEIPDVLRAGMTSFKMYMAYDGIRVTDAEMLTAFEALRAHGGLTIVHAENHALIMHEIAKHVALGHTAPRWHPFTRPVMGEAEATQRALALAEAVGVPMHIVHVTAAQGLDVIRSYQARGLPMSGEVCTQHLLLTDALYAQDGFEPAKYVMAPPLRPAPDTAAMWRGLQDNSLAFVVTDHCPFTMAQRSGKRRTPEFRKLPGGTISMPDEEAWSQEIPAFNKLPGGGPGIETRMLLTYHFGVNEKRFSLNQFVALTSTNAAKLYGLYPRKGTIAPGADADLVLWNPQREIILAADALHQNVDYTPYENWRVRGAPQMVLARGEVIVRDEKFIGAQGRGAYLKRAW